MTDTLTALSADIAAMPSPPTAPTPAIETAADALKQAVDDAERHRLAHRRAVAHVRDLHARLRAAGIDLPLPVWFAARTACSLPDGSLPL